MEKKKVRGMKRKCNMMIRRMEVHTLAFPWLLADEIAGCRKLYQC
ncbi:hypothetical protein [Virgibacillus dokdonensis]|uniref:Uncharacterized protein n=1 Tax=Virgibacillus dokdonensis TaxID=302167 RepID=A0ABU7VG67_9BACI|nr:hypothetical protein [Virgibacillus dokdonensis]